MRGLCGGLALALCGACAGKDGESYDTGVASGEAEACLSGSADGGGETLAISATVVSDEASTLACATAGGRVLTLSDSNANTWTLGYAVWDLDGADVTEALDVEPGDALTLLVRRDDEPGGAFGFALSDTASVVAAFAIGRGGAALQDGDVPGLTVTDGGILERVETECGAQLSEELIFQGDASITLAPFEDRLITVGETALTAVAVRNTRYASPDEACAEAREDEVWAIWR